MIWLALAYLSLGLALAARVLVPWRERSYLFRWLPAPMLNGSWNLNRALATSAVLLIVAALWPLYLRLWYLSARAPKPAD